MRLGLIPRILMAASFAAASPAALAELIPPAPVNDLAVIVVSNNRVGLRWTATGDDGNVGRATLYDVRWAPGLITAANFAGANLAAGEPVPGNPGTIEQFAVFPLPASTTLSFALKVIDDDGNASTISNVVIATTTATDQAAPTAVILAGTPSLLGQVSITWAAPGDDGPFGTAASYDLRRSLAPITTLLQFNAATPVVGEPPPAPAGTPQGMTVGGLQPGKDWYFAMRAFDEVLPVPNGSSVPTIAMFVATLPQYLEFGPVTSLLRIETVATAYGAVTDLGGGSYRLTGSASVTMGGSSRPFSFVNLTTISGDTAGNGERALRVTAGSATVDAAAAPIPFPVADDLELSLYSFSLGPTGATTTPGVVLPPAGLVLKFPASLTTPQGDMLPLPPGVGLEQDLDFTSTMTAPGFWFAPKDYPFRIAPQVGVSYQVSRTRVDLGLSDLLYQGKERGEEVAPGVTRCAASGACDDEANDGIFGLAWNLNAAATPSFDRNGLRATLTHGPVGTTYTLFFPAGVQIALNAGSTIEFTNTEPSGGSLSGTLTVSLHSGAALTDFLDGFIITNDCTGEQTYSATFSGGQLLAGGQIQIGSLSPAGWTDLFFGGAGNYLAARDPRGFFVGGLDASRLSFYAPGTVARIGGARPTVEDHLLAEKSDGAIDQAGTYAGLTVRLDGLNPGTTGLDASCPPPPDPPGSGHSLSVNTTKTRVYVRRSGVTGTADVGSFVPPGQPFLYMGYDMALGRYGVSFRDNIPIDSGINISNIIVPSPADVFFSFDTPATIDGCAEFSGRDLGNMVNAGAPQILACWEADFTPRAARFDQADCAGGPCAPVIPVNCPDIACAELRYLRVSSEAPLDLEPNDPPKPDRFRDLVPMDFTLEPLGPLACSDIILTGGAGSLRNKLENDYGFDIDLIHASLEPRNPACGAGAGPAPAAIGSGTPRYDVLGEILVPFYDAPGGCVRVTQGGGVETLRDCGSFDPVEEKVHVTRKILAGLVDLDFDLKYLPPIKVPGQETAARFVSESAVLDFKFIKLPASVKLFGALPAGLGSAPRLKPELYMGFLSDLAIFTEANPDLAACNPGSSCRTFLDEMMKLDNDALPTEIPTLDQVIPSLEAGASRLGGLGGNLRAIIADAMSSQFADGLPADIARAAGRVKGVVDGVREVGAAVDQPFKALNLSGPGAFHDIPGAAEAQDWVLDQINIDADVDIAGFLDFKGFVNFNSHTANTEDEHAVEDTADVTVGAHDVDLGWAIDGVKAKTVQATFRFDPPPGFRVWGFDGEINLNGVKFGEVQFDELGFLLGMGNPTAAANDDYYYLAGMGRGKYKAVTAAGGFFLGKSDGIAPIERIDPEVGEVLEGLDTLTGIYVRAEASFPVLGGPECVPFRLNAGGGAAFWLFEEGPTFGAKIRAYATGSLVCAVTARADLTLLGGLTDDVWYLNGYGFLAGGVGWCEPNDWDTRRDVLNDDWCLSCVMDGEFSTSSDSGSGTIDGELHGPDCSGP